MLEVARANAATLTELRMDSTVQYWTVETLRVLLEAAPRLLLLEVALACDQDDQVTRAMVRNVPPFQALRLRRLIVCTQNVHDMDDGVAFCSALRCHASIEKLNIHGVELDTAAAMGALVDACIVLRLRKLALFSCRVVPEALPKLTRVVAAGALRDLALANDEEEDKEEEVAVFDAAHESTRMFVAAVRASALTCLYFDNLGVLPETVEEAAEFINAHEKRKKRATLR